MNTKRRLRGWRPLLGLAVLSLLMAACGGGGQSPATTSAPTADGSGEPGAGDGLEINIGMFPVISPVPIMREQQLLEEEGYRVNWIPIEGGLPAAAGAIASGQLDFVYANSSSGTVIFSNEPEAAWFVGRSFINMNETVVSEASGLQSIEELADESVVVSGMTTASTLFYEMGLLNAGVTPDRDQFFVAGTGPSMVDVLAVGGTTVAATYVPYSSEMVRRGIGKLLFTASDALGRTEPGDGFWVSRSFASENPEAVEAVLRAQFAATDTIKEDPAAVYETLSEFAGVPVETIEAAFAGDILAPSYAPDVDAMVEVAEIAQQAGFAPDGVDDLATLAQEFANPSFAEQVLASD